jgi:hypothetical protein
MLAVGEVADALETIEEELTWWKLAPGTEVVVAGSGASDVDTTGAEVEEEGTTDVAEEGAEVDDDTATDKTGTELEAAVLPDEAKLLSAVTDDPASTSTFFTITSSPSELVTLMSIVFTPNPLEFSKKLYVCLVVACQVLPPSVLTSSLETALLALTTCMLNQYTDTPSFWCNCRGEVIGQST